MTESADRLVAAVESGQLSRREAVRHLVALAAATFGGGSFLAQAPESAGPTYQSLGLNHLALRVTDIPRSRDFYRKHLGLRVLRESSRNCFMAAGQNHFVALFRAEKPGLDHYCYTIGDYEPSKVVDRLKTAELEPERHEDRVYFDDPDGITLQLSGEWNDYPGERS